MFSHKEMAQKIGQMIIIGFQGQDKTDPGVIKLAEQIKAGHVGGILCFGYNVSCSLQIQELLSFLKSSATEKLLCSIDQEGGQVQRLTAQKGFTDYPTALSLRGSSSKVIEEVYEQMAAELKTTGFNLNFAPVVDLHSFSSTIIGNLERAYSDCPEEVISYAQAVIKAHHRQEILTCLKHFPGHGLGQEDSHKEIVDTTQVAQERELEPYKHLIALGQVEMIMVGHIMNQRYDKEFPATFSSTLILSLLRQKLGYQGVIIADDLHMGGILSRYPLEEAVISAINSGCDLLIFSNNPAAAREVKNFTADPDLPAKIIHWVLKALEDKRVLTERVLEAEARIKKLKQKLSIS